jgi:hypothetical protein
MVLSFGEGAERIRNTFRLGEGAKRKGPLSLWGEREGSLVRELQGASSPANENAMGATKQKRHWCLESIFVQL